MTTVYIVKYRGQDMPKAIAYSGNESKSFAECDIEQPNTTNGLRRGAVEGALFRKPSASSDVAVLAYSVAIRMHVESIQVYSGQRRQHSMDD
jgi:hypothetical protein